MNKPHIVDFDGRYGWITPGRFDPQLRDIIFPGRKRWEDRRLKFENTPGNWLVVGKTLHGAAWSPTAKGCLADARLAEQRPAEMLEARKNLTLPPAAWGWGFNGKPWQHQVECWWISRDEPAFAFFMEMGCVDADTEYLSPTGWRRIADYGGGPVAQFTLDGRAEFVAPLAYVVKPCAEFVHFHTTRGLDQMLSWDHRILTVARGASRRYGAKRGDGFDDVGAFHGEPPGFTGGRAVWAETSPRRWLDNPSIKALCWTVFRQEGGTGIPLTNEQIRVQVAFHADGSYGTRDLSGIHDHHKGVVRIKHQHKKERLRGLLAEARIAYTETPATDPDYSVFRFVPPQPSKTYQPEWWQATPEQRAVILDEIWRWDGDARKAGAFSYSSIHKGDADFVQWCASSLEVRATAKQRVDGTWGVHLFGNGRTGSFAHFMQRNARAVPSVDGKMYCFHVPSTYLVLRRNGCIFVTGNTGKTRVACDTAAYLWQQHKIDCMAVIANSGVHEQWIDDKNAVQRWLPEWVPWTGVVLSTQSLTNRKATETLNTAIADTARLLVTGLNCEALSHASGIGVLTHLLAKRRCLLIVDESSKFKNPTAARTKALVKLARAAPYRRIMTGTSITKGLEDLYAQFQILDPGIIGYSTWTGFRQRYCVMGGFEQREITGYQNEEELQQRIAPYVFRKLKVECMDLPPQVFERRVFDLGKEQKRLYAQVRDEALAELAGGKSMVVNTSAVVTKLQQLANGFLVRTDADDPAAREIIWRCDPNPRIDALLETLEEAGYPPTLIWCRFREDVEQVAQALAKLHNRGAYVTYYGGNSRHINVAAKECFADGRANFFVGQVDAGGTGLDGLQRAPLAVYYSNSHNAESRWQSIARNHRGGTTTADKVTYIDLVARGTVDTKILNTLERKESLAVRTYDALQALLTGDV